MKAQLLSHGKCSMDVSLCYKWNMTASKKRRQVYVWEDVGPGGAEHKNSYHHHQDDTHHLLSPCLSWALSQGCFVCIHFKSLGQVLTSMSDEVTGAQRGCRSHPKSHRQQHRQALKSELLAPPSLTPLTAGITNGTGTWRKKMRPLSAFLLARKRCVFFWRLSLLQAIRIYFYQLNINGLAAWLPTWKAPVPFPLPDPVAALAFELCRLSGVGQWRKATSPEQSLWFSPESPFILGLCEWSRYFKASQWQVT